MRDVKCFVLWLIVQPGNAQENARCLHEVSGYEQPIQNERLRGNIRLSEESAGEVGRAICVCEGGCCRFPHFQDSDVNSVAVGWLYFLGITGWSAWCAVKGVHDDKVSVECGRT